MRRIAFVGLGSMGGPLAELLAKRPFELSVYDPFPKAVEPFDGLARIGTSPADAAADAEIVGICVRDDAQVREVLFGEKGVAESLPKGGLVLIHSTIAVEALQEIAAQLAEKEIAVLDAPVSRTRRTTDEAFVYTMIGGEARDVERAGPMIATFSTNSSHMGPLGAGMATKIANNLVTWVQMVIGLQATVLAIKSGVELEQLLDVMKSNGSLTPSMGAIIGGKFVAPADAERDALFTSQGGIGEKDLSLALDTAGDLGIDTGLIAEAKRLVRGLMAGPALY